MLSGEMTAAEARREIAIAVMAGKKGGGYGVGAALLEAGVDFSLTPDGIAQRDYELTPMLAGFHADRESKWRFIHSPIGAGTSAAAMYDALVLYVECNLLPLREYQGQRKLIHTKGVVIMKTLVRAADTILPTIAMLRLPFVPRYSAHDHTIRWDYEVDGRRVRGELLLLGLDTEKDIGRTKGMQVDQVLISEPGEVKTDIIRNAGSRAGRWQPNLHPGRVIVEGNPPSEAKDGYYGGVCPHLPTPDEMGTDDPPMWGVKDQTERGLMKEMMTGDDDHKIRRRCWWYPSASAECPGKSASFMARIDPAYYADIYNSPPHEQRWQLHGRPATITDGERVAAAFTEGANVFGKYPEPYAGMRLVLAADADFNGAAVIGVMTADGAVDVIAEIFADNQDAEAFGVVIGEVINGLEFPKYSVYAAVCDPAGAARDRASGKQYYKVLSDSVTKTTRRRWNIRPLASHHNRPGWSATMLNKAFRASSPARTDRLLRVHKSCRKIVHAMMSYCWKAGAAGSQFDKSCEATVHSGGDAMRYLAVGCVRSGGLRTRKRTPPR